MELINYSTRFIYYSLLAWTMTGIFNKSLFWKWKALFLKMIFITRQYRFRFRLWSKFLWHFGWGCRSWFPENWRPIRRFFRWHEMRCEPQYFRPRNHWPPSIQSNDCNKQLWTVDVHSHFENLSESTYNVNGTRKHVIAKFINCD